MNRQLKRTLFIIGAFCWFGFALGFGALLLVYVAQGAGLQFRGFLFSTESVLIGLVHVVGFGAAAWLCFVIAAGLWAHGVVPESGNGGVEGEERNR